MPGPAAGPVNSGAPKWASLWWWLFLLVVVWDVALFWPRTADRADLGYSAFLAQVRADDVASVRIAGDAITGTFSRPSPAPSGAAVQSFTEFQTTFPASVGDPRLLELLQAHHVAIAAASTATPWYWNLALVLAPAVLMGGVLLWSLRGPLRRQDGTFTGFGNVKPRVYASEQRPLVTFADVAGATEAKAELQEEVDFLRHPEKYHRIGARIPRGILLVGPPGTGKTLLARAVAGEAAVPFLSLNASEFVEMFVGVGASRVRDLFAKAQATAPSIVFIDELDAVGRRRGAGIGTVNDEREQTLNQLLGELDGFDERASVIVLAATNRPDVLDPALLRPGRFDRQVTIDLPDCVDREALLRIHTRNLSVSHEVDLAVIARATTGLSGADVANLCNEAALTAARANRTTISMADFDDARDRVLLGPARHRILNEIERRTTAYHESGHALVAWLTAAADPVEKVSIIPRGQALGQTEQLPGEDRHNLALSYVNARLAVLLGGRVAEEIALTEITSGAESDLVEATRLARRMVTRWGMGEIGLTAYESDEEQPFLGYSLAQGREYSEMTAARIDRNVRALLETTHEAVRALVTEHRPLLDRLAGELLLRETLGTDVLAEILGTRTSLAPPAAAAV